MCAQVFISYRRNGGESLAYLLYDRLTRDGYDVFLDVESLRSGRFNEALYKEIDTCDDMLLILPEHGLDRCKSEQDWVRLEIEHALRTKKNIIPIMMRNFVFPNDLPESLKDLPNYNGIVANFESSFDGVLTRLKEKFLTPRRTGSSGIPGKTALDDETARLVKRGDIALSDGDWERASDAYSQVIDRYPECAEAYLGRCLADWHCIKLEDINGCYAPFDDADWCHAVEFGGETMKARIDALKSAWDEDWKRCAEHVSSAWDAQKESHCMIAANGVGFIAMNPSGDVLCRLIDRGHEGTASYREAYLNWGKVAAIAAGEYATVHVFGYVALDGRVQLYYYELGNFVPMENQTVSRWKDVASLSISSSHIVALTKGGTVYAYGKNEEGECEVDNWTGITSVVSGWHITAGLTTDGKVLVAGKFSPEERDKIESWNAIKKLIALGNDIVGLDCYGRVYSNSIFMNKCTSIFTRGVVDIIALSFDIAYVNEHHGRPAAYYIKNHLLSSDMDNWMYFDDDILAVCGDHGYDIGDYIVVLKKDGIVNTYCFNQESNKLQYQYGVLRLFDPQKVHSNSHAHKQKNQGSKWLDVLKDSKEYQQRLSKDLSYCAVVREDGTLFMMNCGNDSDGGMEVWTEAKYWTKLVSVKLHSPFLVGLRIDGTVYALGDYSDEIHEINAHWQEIKQIEVNNIGIFGLKRDGRILVYSRERPFSISEETYNSVIDAAHWEPVEQIYTGKDYLVGLKSDGSLLFAGEGKLPAMLTGRNDIIEVFPGNYADDICAMTCSYILLNSRLSGFIDSSRIIQCFQEGSGAVALDMDGHLYNQDGPILEEKTILACMADSPILGHLLAITKYEDLVVCGEVLCEEQQGKLEKWNRTLKVIRNYDGYEKWDRQTLMDKTAEFIRLSHAVEELYQEKKEEAEHQAKRKQSEIDEEKYQRDMLSAQLDQYNELSNALQKLMLAIPSKRREYDRLSEEQDRHNKEYWRLKKEQDKLLEWFGPFFFENEEEYNCSLCHQSRTRLILAERDDKHARCVCAKCAVEEQLYCAVCGEITQQTDRNRIRRDSYCICGNCRKTRQGEMALAGEYIARCDRCGKAGIPLWLEGDSLRCESCRE